MRILLLSQFFQPEPHFKGLPFALALARRGHDVEVLTGFPNYPGGRLYSGYRVRVWQRETASGIPVLRVPIYPSHDRSTWRRSLNYASFALSAATIGAVLARPADVAYVYHPPLTVGFAALALRVTRGIPFVYDVQDLWPDTLASTGMIPYSAAMPLIGAGCRLVYAAASRIAVLSPGFKTALVARGVPEKKISVVYNWCDEAAFSVGTPDGALARTLGMEGRFNVVFAGNMGPAQALDTVLDAATIVAREAPEVQFVLLGGGIDWDRLRGRAAAQNLINVRFIPWLPPAEANRVLAIGDALLVHLKDDPLFAITIPSKTQSYLAAGRPIIMAVAGDAAGLVTRARAGIVCPPESPGELARAVVDLARRTPASRQELGYRGRKYYEDELSLRVGVERFLEIFEDVARTGPRRRA